LDISDKARLPFAANSQQKATQAQAAGRFVEEIFSIASATA